MAIKRLATTVPALQVTGTAGAVASSTLGFNFDTTAKNFHLFANGADAIVAPFASAPTNGDVVTASVSGGNVLLQDGGAPGMTRIAQQVLGSPAATVTFSSIPGTFTNLRLVATLRSDTALATTSSAIQFNGDTGANYDLTYLLGSNATVSTSSSTGNTSAFSSNIPAASGTANVAGAVTWEVFNYAGTTFDKTTNVVGYLPQASTSTQQIITSGNVWLSTAAITSMTVLCGAGNFVAGSTFTLYGMN